MYVQEYVFFPGIHLQLLEMLTPFHGDLLLIETEVR